MVYGFTKQSRGTTLIDSVPGRGTTVRLFFPATTTETGTLAAPPVDVDRGGDERILVVDDRPEVGELVCEMLRELGYTVEFMPNGRSALDRLRDTSDIARPHLVFSDVVMPGGINGYALAREIRASYPDTHVLLTTGFDRDFALTEDRNSGHYEVIRKPYRLADLAKRVRSVLDGPTGAQRH